MSRVVARWWIGLPFLVAVVLGLTIGYPIAWLAYAAFNVVGVWLYCDRYGAERVTAQRCLKVASALMLPAGIVGMLGSSGGGRSPSMAAAVGSGDGEVTKEAQRGLGMAARGGAGHP